MLKIVYVRYLYTLFHILRPAEPISGTPYVKSKVCLLPLVLFRNNVQLSVVVQDCGSNFNESIRRASMVEHNS